MHLSKNTIRKTLPITLFAIALLIIGSHFLINLSFPDTNWEIRKDDKIKFKANHPITQKFEATKGNLSKIEILFSKSNSVYPGGELKLDIFDEDCSNKLRSSSVSFSRLDSENTYTFTFKRIPDSENKTYCLELNLVPKKDDIEDIQVFIIKNDSDENKYLHNSRKDKEYPKYSLSMRPGYRGDNYYEDGKILVQRISQYKPWFFKDFSLLLIFFLAITISTLSVVAILLI